MEKNDYSLTDVLKTLIKNRKYIIYTTLAAAVLSAIISLLLPVFYKAKTSFYAASPDLGLPNVIGVNESDREVYGSDYDIDRLLSIAESEAVYAHLINEYDLFDHYNIDTVKARAPYYVREELKDLYKVLKTKLGAIEISVEDEDPLIASNMANSARDKINELSQKLMKESQFKTLVAYRANIESQEIAAKNLSDSLLFYKEKYNVINTKSQGEVYSELVTKAKSDFETSKASLAYFKNTGAYRDSIRKYTAKTSASEKKLQALEEDMKIYNQGSAKVEQLVTEFERLTNQLALDRQREKLLQSAYESSFSALHLVEAASPPVIKSKPMRALIVIACSFLAFVLSCAFVLIRKTNTMDWGELWNEK